MTYAAWKDGDQIWGEVGGATALSFAGGRIKDDVDGWVGRMEIVNVDDAWLERFLDLRNAHQTEFQLGHGRRE